MRSSGRCGVLFVRRLVDNAAMHRGSDFLYTEIEREYFQESGGYLPVQDECPPHTAIEWPKNYSELSRVKFRYLQETHVSRQCEAVHENNRTISAGAASKGGSH